MIRIGRVVHRTVATLLWADGANAIALFAQAAPEPIKFEEAMRMLKNPVPTSIVP